MLAAACTALDGLSGGGDPVVTPAIDGGPRPNPCAKNLDDDHDNCGACGAVCGAVEQCLAGKCAPGCPGRVVYVSTDGNDTATGCTSTAPKRTIGAALAFVKTVVAEKHAIQVCRGSYPESVLLDYPVDLRGGYECGTWQRGAAYGYPTFDRTTESLVTGTNTTPPLTFATVKGVVVDGFTLRGADMTVDRVVAVSAVKQARPKIANSVLVSGNGKAAASPASIALQIDDGAFVEVERCDVRAGAAQNTTAGGYGSVGIDIAVKAAGVRVTESRVDGGGGIVNGGTGSVGILGHGQSEASIVERSSVAGGSGFTKVGSASYGIGFFGGMADVTITDTLVHGGTGSCASTCAVTGVAVSTKGKVTLTGSRVIGGEAQSEAFDGVSFAGVRLTDYATADVQNVFVFSGNTKKALVDVTPNTFVLRDGGSALVAHNTFIVGPGTGTQGRVVSALTTSTTFANNLFVNGASDVPGNVLEIDACAGRTYAFQSNRFVGFPSAATLMKISTGTPCTAPASPTSADAFEIEANSALGPGKASGNARITDTCATDTKCTPVGGCGSGESCAATFFAGGWNPLTAGSLLTTGWKLGASSGCLVARAGAASIVGLTGTDGFGAMRTTPRSIGAHENDTCP